MTRESEPQRHPSETVQTQRVIAKEGELKQLTHLLEEVMCGLLVGP